MVSLPLNASWCDLALFGFSAGIIDIIFFKFRRHVLAYVRPSLRFWTSKMESGRPDESPCTKRKLGIFSSTNVQLCLTTVRTRLNILRLHEAHVHHDIVNKSERMDGPCYQSDDALMPQDQPSHVCQLPNTTAHSLPLQKRHRTPLVQNKLLGSDFHQAAFVRPSAHEHIHDLWSEALSNSPVVLSAGGNVKRIVKAESEKERSIEDRTSAETSDKIQFRRY